MEPQNLTKTKLPLSLGFASFVIIIGGVMYSASIMTPLLMALFISIVSAQPILWMQSKKVPQAIAILLVFALFTSIFIGFGGLIGSSLSTFSENSKVYGDNLREIGNSIIQILNDRGINVSFDQMSTLVDPSKVMSLTAGMLGQLGGLMGNAFTIFFLALFLLFEMDSITVKTNAILKNSTVSSSYLKIIIKSIRHYLSIKTVTSLLTGLCIWIFLLIIGVDYAILWALIAFLLNYIPNIGSIIAGIPAVLFALIQLGFGGFIWTFVSFVVVNVLVGSVLEPKMMGRGMGLSTFVVFLSLIFWGFVLGTIGMFLSVPLTMSIKIMLEQNPETKWIAIILGTQDDAEANLKLKNHY